MWINETGRASFWLSVLTDVRARGVNDIRIACTDDSLVSPRPLQRYFRKRLPSSASYIRSVIAVNMSFGKSIRSCLLTSSKSMLPLTKMLLGTPWMLLQLNGTANMVMRSQAGKRIGNNGSSLRPKTCSQMILPPLKPSIC